MAIVQEEYVCANGVILTYTYSDNNKKIRQIETGNIYDDAYDIPNRYTYEETDIESDLPIVEEPIDNEGEDIIE